MTNRLAKDDNGSSGLVPAIQPPVDICVVGGAGHVGLPLSIVFAGKRQRVLIYDVNQNSLDLINSGRMPFMEHGAEPLLKQALSGQLVNVK